MQKLSLFSAVLIMKCNLHHFKTKLIWLVLIIKWDFLVVNNLIKPLIVIKKSIQRNILTYLHQQITANRWFIVGTRATNN